MLYEVLESDHFLAALEECATWLYTHNLEYSMELADRKFAELEFEVNNLKNHLKTTPHMGRPDSISGLRNFSVYEGRFLITWLIDESRSIVTIHEFIDLKYPKQLRTILIED